MSNQTYSDTFFKSSDIRECRFFIQTLKGRNIQPKTVQDTKTLSCTLIFQYDEKKLIDVQKIINDTIFLEYKNADLIRSFINETRNLMNNILVSTKLINSLFVNDRALFYAWTFLQIITLQPNSMYKYGNRIERNFNHIESNIIGNSKPLMTTSISNIIDSISGGKIEKETLIYEINEKYTTSASKYRNAFKWLQKNDTDECERILKGLIKEIKNTSDNFRWNTVAIDVCQKIFVHNPYIAIYTLFYIWLASDQSKEKFIQKTYKSWGQNEYRRNDKGNKKKITIFISQASLDCLKSMRGIKKKSNDEIIDELIASTNDYSTL